jgi:pimeloyl-ACP methyl ester carboxylesterase
MSNNALSGNKVNEWGKESKGKALVFLHYFGGAADSWQWVCYQLSKEYQCYAINLPGFGGTEPLEEPSVKHFAEYVLQLVNELNLDSFTLIGHSMGGKVAMQVAANAPAGMIEQLILLAPSPPTIEAMPEEEKQQMLIHPSAEAATANIKKNSVQPLSTDAYEIAVATNYMVDGNTWRWWIEQGMSQSIADNVAHLQMPVTVLSSTDDPAITSKMIHNEVMPNLKGARLIETQDVGHLYPLEQPSWVAEMIRQLVK